MKQLKSGFQLLLSSTLLPHNEFLLLFKQCDESSGTADTRFGPAGDEAELSVEP